MSRMLQNERRAVLSRTRPQVLRAVPVTEIPDEHEPDTQVEDDVLSPPASPKPPEDASPAPCSIKWPFLSMLAPSVCVRAILERGWALMRSSVDHRPSLRLTVLAGAAFLGILFCAGIVAGEIDLNRLMPGATSAEGRPVVVVQNGRLTNTGAGPALNLEVTRPRYRLIGTLAVGQSIELPGPDFAVQFEWTEGGRTQRATRSFKVGDAATATNGRVAGANNGVASAAQSGAPTAELAPPGIAATYDPATHLLTVTAQKPVEVRVDGFLLRPISRTEKEGAQFRYVQANVLVLGQDIRQGDTVQFEVVFTQPQNYYSIPIYVREPGKPFVYFTVSVALQPDQQGTGAPPVGA